MWQYLIGFIACISRYFGDVLNSCGNCQHYLDFPLFFLKRIQMFKNVHWEIKTFIFPCVLMFQELYDCFFKI